MNDILMRAERLMT